MPSLSDTLARLDARQNWERQDRTKGWRVDLAPVRDLLGRLGHPERGRRTVHVTGSKGKGSVCALISAGLRAAGWRTGTYGSPHVERIHERIRLDGAEIGDGALVRALGAVMDAQDAAAGGAAAEASWFDLMTAAGLVAFRDADVDWQVLEVGLGGRLDSTNAVRPELCVITNIELEHTGILGDTREAIAREKAGIAKRGVPLVSAVSPGDPAGDAIRRETEARGGQIVQLDDLGRLDLEQRNLVLARACLATLGGRGHRARDGGALGSELLDPTTQEGARLPGRLERRTYGGVPVLLDGAHVPASLARVLEDAPRDPRFTGIPVVVLGVHSEKNLPGLIDVLLKGSDPGVDTVIGVSTPGGVHFTAEEIAAAVGPGGEAEPDPVAALARAAARVASTDGAPSWILVTGSLYTVGAVRSALDDEAAPC